MEISEEQSEVATPWTVDGLIGAAEKIMASEPGLFAHPESDSSKDLNIRLIRDYVVREFIPRPVRVGREGHFGLEHLVQLLAVRLLLRSQKWSLPAIKASFATTTTEELLSGTLQPVRCLVEAEYRAAAEAETDLAVVAEERVRTPELNPAQLLIEQFRSRAGIGLASKEPVAASRTMSPAPSPTRKATGGARQRIHIELGPGCEVVVDEQRMKLLTPREVERLGEALKARLLDQTAR